MQFTIDCSHVDVEALRRVHRLRNPNQRRLSGEGVATHGSRRSCGGTDAREGCLRVRAQREAENTAKDVRSAFWIGEIQDSEAGIVGKPPLHLMPL
eukprot:3480572-Pleurochrysis_carterae.AAC.1